MPEQRNKSNTRVTHPAVITNKIKQCRQFSELSELLNSGQKFDDIHITAFFSCLVKLWGGGRNQRNRILPEFEASCSELIAEAERKMGEFSPRSLATIANVISRLPFSVERAELLSTIAEHVCDQRSLDRYEPQALANLANAVSKVSPEGKASQDLILMIAEHVFGQRSLDRYKPQELGRS